MQADGTSDIIDAAKVAEEVYINASTIMLKPTMSQMEMWLASIQ